jgi:hypothetical protein
LIIVGALIGGLVVGAMVATYLPKYLRWRRGAWDREQVDMQMKSDPILGDKRAA